MPRITAAHSVRNTVKRRGLPQVLEVVQLIGYAHGLGCELSGFSVEPNHSPAIWLTAS